LCVALAEATFGMGGLEFGEEGVHPGLTVQHGSGGGGALPFVGAAVGVGPARVEEKFRLRLHGHPPGDGLHVFRERCAVVWLYRDDVEGRFLQGRGPDCRAADAWLVGVGVDKRKAFAAVHVPLHHALELGRDGVPGQGVADQVDALFFGEQGKGKEKEKEEPLHAFVS